MNSWTFLTQTKAEKGGKLHSIQQTLKVRGELLFGCAMSPCVSIGLMMMIWSVVSSLASTVHVAGEASGTHVICVTTLPVPGRPQSHRLLTFDMMPHNCKASKHQHLQIQPCTSYRQLTQMEYISRGLTSLRPACLLGMLVMVTVQSAWQGCVLAEWECEKIMDWAFF